MECASEGRRGFDWISAKCTLEGRRLSCNFEDKDGASQVTKPGRHELVDGRVAVLSHTKRTKRFLNPLS